MHSRALVTYGHGNDEGTEREVLGVVWSAFPNYQAQEESGNRLLQGTSILDEVWI